MRRTPYKRDNRGGSGKRRPCFESNSVWRGERTGAEVILSSAACGASSCRCRTCDYRSQPESEILSSTLAESSDRLNQRGRVWSLDLCLEEDNIDPIEI